jgi:outer membrane protein assembly factor BamA
LQDLKAEKNRLLAQGDCRTHLPLKTTPLIPFHRPRPTVEINVEGYKVRRGNIRKYVPVYEEGALDDDLLNEGRRNLLDYMQTRGYFDASVGIRKHGETNGPEYQVTYFIDPGERYKLASVKINVTSPTGSPLFNEEDIRSRMQVQPAARILSHGKYSSLLLNADVRNLQELYRSNGFRDVKIETAVDTKYQGHPNLLAVSLKIDEGVQTKVGDLKIVGNSRIPTSNFEQYLATSAGQGYSELNLAQDRDTVLNLYYDRGFPNASFDITTDPVPSDAHSINVLYTIKR